MKCTICSGEFKKVEYNDIIVMKCNECGSFYVKEDMFKALTVEPEKYANILDDPEYVKYEEQNKKKKKCPECNKNMEQHNFSWNSEIIIDVCNDCRSVCLDHGEISILSDYIETHHAPVFKDIKHDLGRALTTIKYFVYKIGNLFP